jgi:prepilin-type N-terminal cleavage/methylation domain-containing protein
MSKRGFTLIEVVVSVALIFVIGLALNKIALSNVETLENYKNYNKSFTSAPLNSSNEYKDINSYFGFGNSASVPVIDKSVSKRSENIGGSVVPYGNGLTITYSLNKKIIKIDDETTVYISID